MPRRKRKTGGEEIRGDEWLATFSDTITLLLTFFILLYSFSTVDVVKLKQISTALQNVLMGQAGDSILDRNLKYGQEPIVGENTAEPEIPIDLGKDTLSMYQKVKEYVEKNDMEAVVKIEQDRRGIVIQLRDNVLFDSGSAYIKENSREILEKISSLVATFPNEIIVEGHTDNVPISTYRYDSNWELSTARAVSVLRYFVETRNHNPVRFTAAGYGEFKPVAPNNSFENKAMNRRVNIVIVVDEKEKTLNE
jgi:chemotaxis protein MotB